MKFRPFAVFGVMTLCAGLGINAQTDEWKAEKQIITFEAPGTSSFTVPVSISSKEEITGYYFDSNSSKTHGFVRHTGGDITTFDGPGALETYGTFPAGINAKGEISGYYGTSGAVHGFFRDKDGNITAFDVPNAVAFEGTFASGINSSGEIVGFTGPIVPRCCGPQLGFLRHTDSTITTFEVPASSATTAASINPRGEITGYYYEIGILPGTVGEQHGFLRHEDGTITTFDVQGPGGPYATQATSINPSGEVTGYYYDANNSQASGVSGFLRHENGEIIKFDAPDAAPANFGGTFAVSINPAGEITGYYNDVNNVIHGFVRDVNGKFKTFDPPGSIATYPTSINPSGEITGHYFDANSRSHGFLRKADHREESMDESVSQGSERAE
jgi:hypothetical protein